MKNKTGKSWIEINNMVHMFAFRDLSHTRGEITRLHPRCLEHLDSFGTHAIVPWHS